MAAYRVYFRVESDPPAKPIRWVLSEGEPHVIDGYLHMQRMDDRVSRITELVVAPGVWSHVVRLK